MANNHGVSDEAILSAWHATKGKPILVRLQSVLDLVDTAREHSLGYELGDRWEAGYDAGREAD